MKYCKLFGNLYQITVTFNNQVFSEICNGTEIFKRAIAMKSELEQGIYK